MVMQRFTAYIIQVTAFGVVSEVGHRYGDFETLHRSLLTDCPHLRLPPLPPKGVDGTDAAVIRSRTVELEKLMRTMLSMPEVLTEKNLHFWKFLELTNPTIITTRFVAVPHSRGSSFKTLGKLVDPKYKDDIFRVAHPAVVELLMEGLQELRQGQSNSGHWVRHGGRTVLCQLLGAALGASETIRNKLLQQNLMGQLLGLVERDEEALDDARIALNIIVARESERMDALMASLLRSGGLSQLAALVQRERCQEFVAKLLWLSWEKAVRGVFAQPGGQGLRILQALLRSNSGLCALLGGVLLGGLVAGGEFDEEPGHRTEAVRLVRESLSNTDGADDPAFGKTLCGSNGAMVKLAMLTEDPELAPLVLGLLCAAKPQPAKLSRIAGNLAAVVSDKTGTRHSEETRARAAELLLHVQSGGTADYSTSTSRSSAYGGGGSAGQSRGSWSQSDGGRSGGYPSSSPAPVELERCEGIAEHEESLDAALRRQLEDGFSRSHESLQTRGVAVHEAADMARRRLKEFPPLSFDSVAQAFASFKSSRDMWRSKSQESEMLLHDMQRQLSELKVARPSTLDPHTYKERLLAAERIYAEVKSQREQLAAAELEAAEKQARADTTSSESRQAANQVRQLEDEINSLRIQRSEKEMQATRLQHRASTPNVDAMRQQIEASIERSVSRAKELQTIGQRVNQGDPDYLRDGESKQQKIAQLTQELATLKKQHEALVQQKQDLEFDPVKLQEEASKLQSEALELHRKSEELEHRRLEADRERGTKMTSSTIDTQEARAAQDRRQMIATQLASTESEARRQMSALQPMIQDHHAGWQRLLAQQKKLDADHSALNSKLEEVNRAAASENSTRAALAERIDSLIGDLHRMQGFLDEVAAAAPAVVPTVPPPVLDDFEHPAQVTSHSSVPPQQPRGNVFEESEEVNDVFRDDYIPQAHTTTLEEESSSPVPASPMAPAYSADHSPHAATSSLAAIPSAAADEPDAGADAPHEASPVQAAAEPKKDDLPDFSEFDF